jgi:parvulin-like peptidyl-prolyl isomerase
MRILKPITAIVAVGGVALAVSACGSSVPSDSVASMAGNSITTQAFNHWMFVAAKSNATQSGTTQVIVPTDPPDFKGCIKQVRQQIPSLSKTTDKTLKADCSQLFTELNSQVMDFLIKAYWYQADAYKQGIHLTTAQVNKAFDNAKTKQFKSSAQYKTFLTETGQTNADILFRVRVNTLYQKLLKAQTKAVTAAAVQNYYNAHKSQFGTPASRNLLLVRTSTKSAADQALAALNSGQSWSAVASKYSVDAATKKTGGVLNDVTNGQEEQALNTVAFAAPVGKIEGPVHGTFGWYVVKVTKTNPGSQQSMSKASVTIKQLLKSNAQTAAGTAVNNEAKKNWGNKTICRSGYSMADCKGYTPPKTTSTATPTPAPTSTSTTGATTTTPTTTTSGH